MIVLISVRFSTLWVAVSHAVKESGAATALTMVMPTGKQALVRRGTASWIKQPLLALLQLPSCFVNEALLRCPRETFPGWVVRVLIRSLDIWLRSVLADPRC